MYVPMSAAIQIDNNALFRWPVMCEFPVAWGEHSPIGRHRRTSETVICFAVSGNCHANTAVRCVTLHYCQTRCQRQVCVCACAYIEAEAMQSFTELHQYDISRYYKAMHIQPPWLCRKTVIYNVFQKFWYCMDRVSFCNIQSGARNVVPLIVHITHFYCYKNI